MSINAVSSNTTNNLNEKNNASQVKSLGFNDFMKILITELNHQNPLDPMDNKEFIAQTAQFASLSQMQSLNSSFQNLSNIEQIANNSLSASFIGKNIKFIQNKEGENISVESYSEGTVSGVTFKNNLPYFIVNNQSIPFDNITEVYVNENQN
ncbi:MAG: flagellar hook capping protein [Candidatus Firestonebacteria bacterium]|nr:flagellar hook capping protein [Candidatus Firestonebacteria bacterium]